MFETFSSSHLAVNDSSLFVRIGGDGPAVLLLHGFPETHLMWRDIAPRLAEHFTVICADLRGYGDSGCPTSDAEHRPYAKRAMAAELVEAMAALGHARFAVVGHDRGGRVAYRMALDHPAQVTHLSVLDIIPTHSAWERTTADMALAFWPWTLLAQPEPLPERLIGACPQAVVDNALDGWGSRPDAFPEAVRRAYVDALRDPPHVHAICEEYRAAATIDREHDAEDARQRRRIHCPIQVLWSAEGGLNAWYAADGGPLAIWQAWADDVVGTAMEGGHFFPEEHPQATAEALRNFLQA